MDTSTSRSIMNYFSSIPDPRMILKTRHKLTEIITIALCAVIAGADDWVEISDFGEAKKEWFKTFLELPGGIPSHDTFGRVFSLLDPREFEKSFMGWIRSFVTGTDIVAIDGKTLRRSHDRANGQSTIHMVNAWAVRHGLILGQLKTADKSNEITAIPELMKTLDLRGCIVTADAMGCQKEIARQIVDQGADYVLALKGNQGTLHDDVQLFFAKQQAGEHHDSFDTFVSVDGGHGRVETRRFTITSDVRWFSEYSKWPGLRSFGMVQSERQEGDRVTQETRYFISSLPNDAKGFAEAARGHWGVENSLHWCLDIAFREDDSRIRQGHAAENMAVLRSTALSLIKHDKSRKNGVKASRKRAGWDNDYLMKLLVT